MKKMLLFVNPAAGREEMRHALMDVISRFTAAGYEVICHPTQKPQDVTEVVAAVGSNYDIVVTCGGDGTLNETVTGLMRLKKRPILGYIPTGTVNDFATSLNIPKTIPEAVNNIIEGVPFPVDIGGFNGRYFTYVAAFGAFTKVSYATPHASKQALGRTAYLLEGLRALPDIRPIHVKVTAGETVIEDDVLLGMVTNATSVGGFKALDEGIVKMDDGLNELILVRNTKDLAEFNALMGGLLLRDFNPERFHILQAESVILEFQEKVPWTLDGEFGGETDRAEVINIPAPIRIMVPGEA